MKGLLGIVRGRVVVLRRGRSVGKYTGRGDVHRGLFNVSSGCIGGGVEDVGR